MKHTITAQVRKLFIPLVCMILFNSCATIIRGKKHDNVIPVSGYPEGADVYMKNQRVGTTPMSLELNSRKSTTITIRKEGFQEEHIPILTKPSIGWSLTSLTLGTFGFWIPTVIDIKTGAINRVVTDSINYKLSSIVPENQTIEKVNDNGLMKSNVGLKSETSLSTIAYSNDQIANPAIQIRTLNTEVNLQSRSTVTVSLKNGAKLAGCIGTIGSNSFNLLNSNLEIQYSDINSIRVYPTRRWLPIVTSVVVIPPIIWYLSSKNYTLNSTNCKKRIFSIKTTDFVLYRAYGKPICK